MKIKTKILGFHKLIVIVGSILFSFNSYAQIVPPPIPPPPPPGLPIDGGIGFLILGAIIYGVKNSRNK